MSRKGSMPSEGESGRPRPPWRLRDVYDLLEQVRARPLMWLRSRSLRELRTLLTGYHLALCVHGAGEDFAFGPGGPFAEWLRRRFGAESSLDWGAFIERNAGGREPLDLFFDLLEEYRSEQRSG
ncbi:hypothetical protein [Nocardiopsis composta]